MNACVIPDVQEVNSRARTGLRGDSGGLHTTSSSAHCYRLPWSSDERRRIQTERATRRPPSPETHLGVDYSTIVTTMPAPTVRPPSRMAKRSFSSMAIGTISSTSTVTLSPGITISVPSGSDTMPVTSVVRK